MPKTLLNAIDSMNRAFLFRPTEVELETIRPEKFKLNFNMVITKLERCSN